MESGFVHMEALLAAGRSEFSLLSSSGLQASLCWRTLFFLQDTLKAQGYVSFAAS